MRPCNSCLIRRNGPYNPSRPNTWGTYATIKDSAGDIALTVSASAAGIFVLDPAKFLGIQFIKIAVTSATDGKVITVITNNDN